jgi:hypothetical protein
MLEVIRVREHTMSEQTASLEQHATGRRPSKAMLLDRYLPTFDVTIIEHLVVDADVRTTWTALQDLDLVTVHTPLMDAAMFARGLPAKIASVLGRDVPPQPAPPELKIGATGPAMDGWLSLGQIREREVAFAAVGRFWQPEIEWYDTTAMTPEEFADFHVPGWGRIGVNFSLRPYGETRTLVSYEARTVTPDPMTARRFRRYWTLVRPFVGHIMRATLATLARAAVSDETP